MAEIRLIGVVLLLLFSGGRSTAAIDLGRAQSLAVEANRAYEAGDYVSAVESYRGALEEGLDHAILHYNLGNAWFKQGELGEAIASYRRALRRDPRDANARANLERAEALIRDEALAPLSIPLFLRPLSWTYAQLSLNAWSTLALIAIALACLIGGAAPWLPAVARRRKALLWFVGGVALIAVVMAGTHYRFELSRESAVIIAGEVEVRSGPGEDYELSFKIHEGLTVYVDESRGEWTRIHLGGELVGWVPTEHIESI